MNRPANLCLAIMLLLALHLKIIPASHPQAGQDNNRDFLQSARKFFRLCNKATSIESNICTGKAKALGGKRCLPDGMVIHFAINVTLTFYPFLIHRNASPVSGLLIQHDSVTIRIFKQFSWQTNTHTRVQFIIDYQESKPIQIRVCQHSRLKWQKMSHASISARYLDKIQFILKIKPWSRCESNIKMTLLLHLLFRVNLFTITCKNRPKKQFFFQTNTWHENDPWHRNCGQ